MYEKTNIGTNHVKRENVSIVLVKEMCNAFKDFNNYFEYFYCLV